MERICRGGLVLLIASLVVATIPAAWPDAIPARAASPGSQVLKISVQPRQIPVGRDVALRLMITNGRGAPLDGALVSVTGGNRPVFGRSRHGLVGVTLRASALGQVEVHAVLKGYAPASLKVSVVPGSPASIAVIKRGMSVLAPGSKPRPGQIGADLFAGYHAVTSVAQYGSLSLRDGTLVDLNSNTDVQISDPLHQRLTRGELFMEVVHGVASHVVQAGAAVAATKGTGFDIKFNATTKTVKITVVTGLLQVTNGAKTVLVGGGQQTTVVATRPPTPPVPANVSVVVSWTRNVPSPPSVVVAPVVVLPPSHITVAPPPHALPRTSVSGAIINSTWSPAGSPYLVTGHLDVPASVTLAIAPGTYIALAVGAYMTVEGVLLARGTAGAPIIVTSAQERPVPGDWYYLQLAGKGASASVLDHVQLYYGGRGGGTQGELWVTGGAAPTVTKSVFSQSAGTGIYADDASVPRITGSTLAGNVGVPLSLPVDAVGYFGTGMRVDGPGIQVRGTAFTHDAAWPRTDIPLVISGHLDVPISRTLTLAPGAILALVVGAYMTVEGTLIARGIAGAPIIVTSAQERPVPGDWYYLQLAGKGASASVLDHVQLYYGGRGGGTQGELWVTGGAAPTVTKSVFSQSAGTGLYVDDASLPRITGCTFAVNVGVPLSLPMDDVGYFGTGMRVDGPGIQVRATAFTHDATWLRTDIPLIVSGHLDVPISRTLTLAPGLVLEEVVGTYMTVEGSLIARGTAEAPIIVTSAQAQPVPGDWYYLQLAGKGASASVLDHVQLYYGGRGGGTQGELWVTGGAAPTITNSVFSQSAGTGIYADSASLPTVVNCAFQDNASYAVSIPALDAQRVHDNQYGSNQLGEQLRG